MRTRGVKAMSGAQVRPWAVNRPVRDAYLIFGSPQLLDAEIDEVVATLRSGWIGTGPPGASQGWCWTQAALC